MPAPEPLDERAMLVQALAQAHGNKSAAAERLRWSRMTLYRKLRKYRLGDAVEASGAPPEVGLA